MHYLNCTLLFKFLDIENHRCLAAADTCVYTHQWWRFKK